jgi:predicted membrane-bound spermidine synthase
VTIVAFSGFCSLVYQVVWDRTLRSNFGGDSVSSAIVSATFLLGLGIGAFIFGKWRRQALAIYALVEITIGVYAVVSYYILAQLATILGRGFNYTVADLEGLRSIVVIASILFLLLPCILMGGTLPLVFNAFVHPGAYKNRTVGMLYGLNTIGAALGVLAVPLLFLNRTSIPATLLLVGFGNILLGIGVWLNRGLLSPVSMEAGGDEATAAAKRTDDKVPVRPLLAISFVSGFITLSYEISLLRTVGLMTESSPYTFPIVLMPFILSLALGSMMSTRFRSYSTERALERVGLLFIFAMLGMIAGVLARYYLASNILLLIIPLPLLLGGVFPLLLRLASRTGKELPGRTGVIYLSNSIGAFAGAMLTQFYGFSNLGTKTILILIFLIGIGIGVACLIWAISRSNASATPHYLIVAAAVVVAGGPLLIPTPVWDIYTFNYTGPGVDKVEGVSGVATINWEDGFALGDVEVNGTYMSALPDHPKHIGLVSMALSLPRRERVLVLGLGGGSMVRELVNDPEVKRVDVVDWSHELPLVLESPKATRLLDNALQDPKVHVHRVDARVAVSLYEDQSFDIIIDNLAILGWAGSTNVKSATYFGEVRRILQPAGVFVFSPNYLWLPDRAAILAGLVENFAFVQEHDTTLVLASSRPVDIDPHRVEAVLASRGRSLGLSPPYADWLLKGFRPVEAEELANIHPISDELLIYEYRYFGNLDQARPIESQ